MFGEVEVDPLAESFSVTPQTIRRDLNQLCQLRLLQRVHGGALVHDGVENLGYAEHLRDHVGLLVITNNLNVVNALRRCESIDVMAAGGAVLDFDITEVRVAQAIIRNARSVILVADAMKFQREAPVRIGNISEMNYFVTDTSPPLAFMEVCRSNDVQVEVISPESNREP